MEYCPCDLESVVKEYVKQDNSFILKYQGALKNIFLIYHTRGDVSPKWF